MAAKLQLPNSVTGKNVTHKSTQSSTIGHDLVLTPFHQIP